MADIRTLPEELNLLRARVAELESTVSELQASEMDPRKSEQDLLELFDYAPLAYQQIDVDGRISMVNRAQERLLGYTSEELLGQYSWKFVEEEDECRESSCLKFPGKYRPATDTNELE